MGTKNTPMNVSLIAFNSSLALNLSRIRFNAKRVSFQVSSSKKLTKAA